MREKNWEIYSSLCFFHILLKKWLYKRIAAYIHFAFALFIPFICFVFRRRDCHICSLVSNWEIEILFIYFLFWLQLYYSAAGKLLPPLFVHSICRSGWILLVSQWGRKCEWLHEKLVQERKTCVRFFTQHLCLLCLIRKIQLICFSFLSKAYKLTGVSCCKLWRLERIH